MHDLVIKMCNGLTLHSYMEPTKELENHNIHFSFWNDLTKHPWTFKGLKFYWKKLYKVAWGQKQTIMHGKGEGVDSRG